MCRPAPLVAPLSLAVLLVAGCEEYDPTLPADLEVLVTVDGEPISGVIVTLRRFAADPAAPPEESPTPTSGTGVARFGFIHPGAYTLMFEHDAVACEEDFVNVMPGDEARHLATCAYVTAAVLLFPGLLEFEQDTVRMNIGDELVLRTAPDEPVPRTVYAPYTLVYSMVYRCTDVTPSIRVVPRPLPCPTVAGIYEGSRPDTAILVDEALMTVIARVMPCARGPDGEPLNPEAWASSGSFSECATWVRDPHRGRTGP